MVVIGNSNLHRDGNQSLGGEGRGGEGRGGEGRGEVGVRCGEGGVIEVCEVSECTY